MNYLHAPQPLVKGPKRYFKHPPGTQHVNYHVRPRTHAQKLQALALMVSTPGAAPTPLAFRQLRAAASEHFNPVL